MQNTVYIIIIIMKVPWIRIVDKEKWHDYDHVKFNYCDDDFDKIYKLVFLFSTQFK